MPAVIPGARACDHPDPTGEELSVLAPVERAAFRIVHRLNKGRTKAVLSRLQREVGARWIHHVALSRRLRVYGIENLEATSPRRPIVIVANHRSYFDLFVVSTVMVRRMDRPMRLYFPVRARYFYQRPMGVVINAITAWGAMYPPIFAEDPAKRAFTDYAVRLLVSLASEPGSVIGIHPEGTRNRSPDPWSLLRAQPGVGRIVHEARPQVIPVWIGGLSNSLTRTMRENFTGRSEPVRVRFGPAVDYATLLDRPARARTYVEIADHLMRSVAALGEVDRAEYGGPVAAVPGARCEVRGVSS